MPLTTIDVGRVDACATSKPGVTAYLITSRDLTFQVNTVSAFAASVCRRGLELDRPVDVLWKDGRFGKQLVDVTLRDRSAA